MFIGNIIAFTGSAIPEGYLECDGSAISRLDYADLFDVIGTTYGSGDGSSTFNLPNLSGKVSMGVSNNYLIGSTGGEYSHVLLTSETPVHYHEVPQHTHQNTFSATTPSLSHTITQPVVTYVKLNGAKAGRPIASQRTPYKSVATATMTRSTNLAIADHPATACTVTGGITDCPAFDTESTGGGVAHNNMMPYLAVRYLIKYGIPIPIEPGMALFNGCCVVSAGGGYITGKTV